MLEEQGHSEFKTITRLKRAIPHSYYDKIHCEKDLLIIDNHLDKISFLARQDLLVRQPLG